MALLHVVLTFDVDPVLYGQDEGLRTIAEAEAQARQRLPKTLDELVRGWERGGAPAGVTFVGYTLPGPG